MAKGTCLGPFGPLHVRLGGPLGVRVVLPQVMRVALRLHNDLLTALTTKYNGYQVMSDGHASMVVFQVLRLLGPVPAFMTVVRRSALDFCVRPEGQVGFSIGGGGPVEPPKLGKGVREKGFIHRTINRLL